MGQKVHPNGIRLGIIHDWDSTWIAGSRDYAQAVVEDHKIRTHLKKKLKNALVSKIVIERKAAKLIVKIVTGRPGVVVSRGGQGIDQIRQELSAMLKRKDIQVDVIEVDKIDLDATLVAEAIAGQLEKRVAFRRAMKQAIQRTLRSGAKGIKVMISGRLAGADIARTEWTKDGRIPLHTFRADIDYGVAEAMTVFGIIGVKVWVFKNEVMPGEKAVSNTKMRSGGGGGEGGHGGDSPQGLRAGRGGGPGGPGGRGKRRGPSGPSTRSGKVRTYNESESPSQPQAQSKPDAPQAPDAE
jgi:small subunit ribosomal protein S3